MIKHYIQAARLRTLPLSISGIIVGSFIAASEEKFNLLIAVLAIFTTVGFQIISNFANDYGDGVKGTDNSDRVGPQRALQSGVISPQQMLKAIKLSVIITLLIAITLIYVAFGKEDFVNLLVFLALGTASIVAAIKYTMGENAYGYSGFGDIFVLLFFGFLSVCGSYYLFTKEVNFIIFLPAAAVGLLSVGVLNLNNMRDRASDIKAGKNTLVVKFGSELAKKYHYSLLIGAFILVLLFTIIRFTSVLQLIYIIAFVPILFHLKVVFNNKIPKELDSELKKLALSTFLFAVLFGLGLLF